MNKTITRRRFVGSHCFSGRKNPGNAIRAGDGDEPGFQDRRRSRSEPARFRRDASHGRRHLGLATRPRKRGQGVEARGRARCEFDRYRRRLRTGNGRAAHRRSAPSLSEGACHRDERRQHPARTRSVGAGRSPRLSQTSCRQESKATSARTDRFVSVAPRRSKSADGRIARRAQGNAERGENPARWIIGSVDVGNRAGA